MLTAATKTFNIAGTLTGNVIIPDPALRKRFAAAHLAAGTSPNRFGALMATAAYDARRRLGRRALPLPRRQRRGLRRRRRRHPRPPPDAARRHLPRLGRLLRHRHGAGRVHRPRREGRPHRRRATAPPSAPAARASSASTSAPRAPASPRRWTASRPPSPTCSKLQSKRPLRPRERIKRAVRRPTGQAAPIGVALARGRDSPLRHSALARTAHLARQGAACGDFP